MFWSRIKLVCRAVVTALVVVSTPWSEAAEVERMGEPASYSWTIPGPPNRVLPRLSADQSEYFQGDLTDYEQYMLEMINRARANPQAEADRLGIDLNENLSPGTISTAPKPPLGSHPQLLAASRAHNQWMFSVDVFSHTGVNGSSPGDRMNTAGYTFAYPAGWGENIAWRGTSAGSFDVTSFVELLHDGLFKSSGHRVNLMNASFDETGVGVNTGYFFKDGFNWNSAMATQTFAYSATTPGPLVVGVVYRDTNGNGFYDPGEGVSGVKVVPDSGAYYAVSSVSGGYAFPFTGTGTLDVEFSCGPLVGPVHRTVNRGSVNLKLDLELNTATPLAIAADALLSTASSYQFTFGGPPDQVVQVQRSVDFVNWDVLATYLLGAEPIVFQDDDPPVVQAWYRVVAP